MERSSKQLKEKTASVEKFFKDAFCVDGEVRLLRHTTEFQVATVIELHDSKRGVFYIGSLEKKNTRK